MNLRDMRRGIARARKNAETLPQGRAKSIAITNLDTAALLLDAVGDGPIHPADVALLGTTMRTCELWIGQAIKEESDGQS